MFYVKNPSALNKPWILSKKGDENVVAIPLEVCRLLKNYHIMTIEFLYHNYRKGVKGAVLNQQRGMNFSLQIGAFLRAIVQSPALILVICSRESSCYWHYHLVNHAGFDVVQITSKNADDTYESNNKIALLVTHDCLKLCEGLLDCDFFSVIVEDLDQLALKRIIKRLNGTFNVGLTTRSFYTHPDQKLQWNMLNWANPGCVGKLNDFYEADNRNFERFDDNYRYWWMRLTWDFCESFEKPTDEETDTYERKISEWASQNDLNFPKKQSRKRKHPPKTEPPPENDSSNDTIINEVPIDKYVKLPSMDESPIVTSIIKNFEISPEPILTRTSSLPYTQTHASYSKYEEDSVLFAFLDDKERPSTSKSESEEFILSLINKSEDESKDIRKKADAVLQN
ncbi:uncharacterized protein LOC103313971 isoform X2 [Tribolium castaneum]|uniref:Uncharacterized protein n=1 Tax=Tribolium castaneum TaxID=7070 RepID=D6WWL3_TRICA|nr:PREDICTED: uncharacterized protein LOC103313971 isoform X2 [Tribolium castaneum]EFA08727.2 hypothetical protein TcasGA2_TC006402 [Tribolium castaneum]|eukprot:XP_008196836.1 PREDICTED: uncharacterized protein LOC103313971 isoform X2 [Tribolium castaneum]